MSVSDLGQLSVGKAVVEYFTHGQGADLLHDLHRFSGFSILTETPDRVLIGEFGDQGLASFVNVVREDGRWQVKQWGDCVPRLVEGQVHAAPFVVVDDDPETGRLDLRAEGGTCVGEPETTSEVVEVEVEESSDAITVTVWVHEPSYEGACAGVGVELPSHVMLDEMVGGRPIHDGGVTSPVQAPAVHP